MSVRSHPGAAAAPPPVATAVPAAAPGGGAGARLAPTYRADIDGLRAFAVLVVIFTHAGVAGFSGGFIGVDVFFVISGYLIHRDLLRRLRDRRFSPLDFYGRRMRRTLPALFVLCAASLAASAVVLLPGDLVDMAHSLVGTLLLVPNLVFLAQTGYFDSAAASKPLLHTWSLGVEEQFYLFAPLLAVALARLPSGQRKGALAGLFLVALAAAILLQAVAPAAAFYLMPARAFEFLVGAALAEPAVPPVRARWLAEGLAATGAAGLALSVLAFSERLPHPGWPTLLPCLSAAALVHVGTTRQTLVGRALGLRWPAGIGLVSYSLYLWHWPILVIARYADLPATAPWRLGEAALLGALSYGSWRFVEQPFRSAGSPWRRRAPLILPGAAAALAACAALVMLGSGLPGRFPPDIASVASFYAYRNGKPFREGRCFITSKDSSAAFDRATCLALAPDKPNMLLIGDSHAAHLWTGLRDAWPGVHFLQATASGCKPLMDTSGAARCTTMMADMLAHFIPAHRLDGVIISALWDDDDVAPLVRTLAALRGETDRLVVFGPMPRYDQPVATLLAQGLLHRDLAGVAAHRLPGTAALDARLGRAVAPFATYVSPYRTLCEAGRCQLFVTAGVPIQFDYHHLTAPGAAALMAQVKARHPDLFAPQRSTSSR